MRNTLTVSSAHWHCDHCSARGMGMTALDIEQANSHCELIPGHEIILVTTSVSIQRLGVKDESSTLGV